MANIIDLLKNIKNAVFGKDVRNSIHDAIKQCYDDAIANGHTDMEVAKARGSYSDLNSRLEAEKSEEKKERKQADSNLQNQINVEKARIDNLSTLQEGSTTGDAELKDIRTGADGKNYRNAGEAVRGQISDLREDIENNSNNIELCRIEGNNKNNYFNKDLQNTEEYETTSGGLWCSPIYLPKGNYFIKGYNFGGWNNFAKTTKKDGTETILLRQNSSVANEYSGKNDYEYEFFTINDDTNFIQFRISNNITEEFLNNCVIGKGSTTQDVYRFDLYYPYGCELKYLRVSEENIQPKSINNEMLNDDFTVKPNNLYEYELINYFNPALKEPENVIKNNSTYYSKPIYLPVGTYTINMIFSFNSYGYLVKKDGTKVNIPDTESGVTPTQENPKITTIIVDDTIDYFQQLIGYGATYTKSKIEGIILEGEIRIEDFPKSSMSYGAYIPWIKVDGKKILDNSIPDEAFAPETISPTKINNSKKYLIFNTFVGKKCVGLGDSIVNIGLVHKIADELNCSYVNFGKDGSRIARLPDQATNEGIPIPISERYVDMDDDADLIVVSCGTNDWANNCPIGTIEDVDNTTLLGALKILCDGLIAKYGVNKPIFFLTPTKRNTMSANSNGVYFEDFCNEIKNYILNYTGFGLFDAYHYGGLNPYNSATLAYDYQDGLHPTDEGLIKVARKAAKYIINYN